jgi:signal transduction histidine kinase
LSFARLQNDRSPMAAVALADIVQEEVAGLSSFAKTRHIKIDVSIDPPAQGHITGVRHALAFMVRNIVHNAVKFSPENAVVQVVLQQRDHALVLCVKDSGPGIAPEHRQKIFDRFYRIQKSQSGTGLGLSIVKWVADLHGAQIDVHTPEQGGLVFGVVFDIFGR